MTHYYMPDLVFPVTLIFQFYCNVPLSPLESGTGWKALWQNLVLRWLCVFCQCAWKRRDGAAWVHIICLSCFSVFSYALFRIFFFWGFDLNFLFGLSLYLSILYFFVFSCCVFNFSIFLYYRFISIRNNFLISILAVFCM